jgi:hypothetical protein
VTAPKLTAPRRVALWVLAEGPARYSNATTRDPDNRTVYWQSADWLIANGLATMHSPTGTHDHQVVTITDAGREAL